MLFVVVFCGRCCCFIYFFGRHETSSGYYRVSVFFVAEVITDLVILRIIPLSPFAVITYFMIGKIFWVEIVTKELRALPRAINKV